jgi:hypothetical protein
LHAPAGAVGGDIALRHAAHGDLAVGALHLDKPVGQRERAKPHPERQNDGAAEQGDAVILGNRGQHSLRSIHDRSPPASKARPTTRLETNRAIIKMNRVTVR